jgi:hypothetical protein
VEAPLTLEVLWHWHRPYCLESLPILWIWVKVITQPLDYIRCNTQNHWCSVDAHFQTGTVAMSRSLLHITAANTLIMGNCRSTALRLYKMQYPKSLTLCWHSVDTLLTWCWCSVDALLTLCWRYVDALLMLSLWCSSIDTHEITYKGSKSFDYG